MHLQSDIEHQGFAIGELHIDRGYIKSSIVDDILGMGGNIISKPWVPRNAHGNLFTKADFRLNMRDMTITCPANEVQPIRLGVAVQFEPATCDKCSLRAQCTKASPGNGRTVAIGADEKLQQRLRKRIATPKGRKQLRERVHIEHRLAHLAQRQGRRARYVGTRLNLFDLRRASAVQNLETIHRNMAA